jgi:hypothetical protein
MLVVFIYRLFSSTGIDARCEPMNLGAYGFISRQGVFESFD